MSAAIDSTRPAVAFISNSYPPYRIHVHRRIVNEVPEIQVWSLATHDPNENARWNRPMPPEINPVEFGPGQSTSDQSSPRNALREWRKGGRIVRWMHEQGVRAVILMGYNDLARLRIIRWCNRSSVPWFIYGDSNIRADRASGAKGWMKKQVVTRLLSGSSGALPCGTAGEAYFRRYGVPAHRIHFYPLEPDYQQIESLSPREIDEAAHRFHLAPGRRRIVFSGRFVDWKRGDLLVAAFARIAAERPQWDLLMIGDGPMRQPWQAAVPASLSNHVLWTGHVSEQAAVSALYRSCDVLVLPSEGEPWALVIIEAAAAGLAVISSSDPGAAVEIVRDGVNGRIFPAGDLDALTRSLLEVTGPANIDRMKVASAGALADWRRRGDPVAGLRRALASVGVIAPAPQ